MLHLRRTEIRDAMILTCPSCTTRYQVDAARFAPPGRQVRCAKCGHVWFQVTPEPEIVPEPEAEPVVMMPAASESEPLYDSAPETHSYAAPTRDPVFRTRAPRFGIARAFGWLVLVLLIGGILFALVEFRLAIATVWPQSSSFYAAIGMPVNVRGLAFSDVTYAMTTEDGQPVLSLAGKLANITTHELPLPMLRVDLNDDQKRSLYHWTFDTGASTLAAGGSLQFVTRLSNPPVETRNLMLRFADAGDDNAVAVVPTAPTTATAAKP
jgi:predicted Zn finger-like uncharacterized protein